MLGNLKIKLNFSSLGDMFLVGLKEKQKLNCISSMKLLFNNDLLPRSDFYNTEVDFEKDLLQSRQWTPEVKSRIY